LPRSEFLRPSGRRRTYCTDCNATWYRAHRWLTKYGITPEQYDQMLLDQGGGCAICGSEEEGRGKEFLHVDHDHKTGKVRGLLCFGCNSGIGHLREDTEIMHSAIHYIERHR
jgi:hypothetical protein